METQPKAMHRITVSCHSPALLGRSKSLLSASHTLETRSLNAAKQRKTQQIWDSNIREYV